jgi:hypothetical protein
MTLKSIPALAFCAGFLLILGACASHIDTVSGSDYLERYAGQTGGGAIDPDIRAAADVEPLLRFPARLGLARIENGALSPIPPAEYEVWFSMADGLGDGWGEFVPISPLVILLASEDAGAQCSIDYGGCVRNAIQDIRLGAARQHVDAVLIYEVFGTAESSSNLLSVTKLALIGFFLPTEDIEADGFAQAILVDVRNGYTYGYATATSEDAATALSSVDNLKSEKASTLDEAETAAAVELVSEVEEMLWRLRVELAEKRSAEAQTDL